MPVHRRQAAAVLIIAAHLGFFSGLPLLLQQDGLAHPQTHVLGGRAGAASTDITPVPGLPTAGHGPAGAITRGYWQRLRATAFYFEDSAGVPSALVSADLFGIPAALHRAIAGHFTLSNARNATGVVLPAERLVIAATHTHHGPGNYLSAELYNKRASKEGGFNEPLRKFLEMRLIRAIESAIEIARSRDTATVDVLTGQLDGTVFRNRSPTVFMRDAEHQAILDALGRDIPADASLCQAARLHDEPGEHWAIEGCPRLRAVDRNVTIVRVRHLGRTEAMALFLNVHPTVLPADTELYSADLFGAARAELERNFSSGAPVIGFFNGAEGDIVTRRTTRTAVDLVNLGRTVARQLQHIHDRSVATVVDLSQGVQGRLHYAVPGEAEPSTGTSHGRLATRPMVGVATLGGAEGDRTWLRLFAKPTTGRPTGEHGVKVPALGWLGKLIAPDHSFPQALPIGIVRIGTLHLVTTPFENSTAASWRIRQALGGRPHGVLEIISMANEYASYLATHDEYAAQDYMGASTLWGPTQARFVSALSTRILEAEAGATGTPGVDAPGKTRDFKVGSVGAQRARVRDGFEALLDSGFVSPSHVPSFEWCGPAPASMGVGERSVEVVSLDANWTDTIGIAVVLRATPKSNRAKWGALWLTPLWEHRRGLYRFRVQEQSRLIESQPFAIGVSPPSGCDSDVH